MYSPLSTEEIQEKHKEYSKDRLFQNLYSAMGSVCANTNDITPEEIWQLASEYVRQIVQTENELFEIDALPNKLYFLLSKYKIDETIIPREDEDIKRTIFFIELVMLYQLMRYQKELEKHPYKKYCLAILGHIKDNPLMEKIIPMIKETNDRYEQMYNGKELEPHDYLPFVIKKDSLIKEAVQLSAACQDYLTYGYDIAWLENFWAYMIHSRIEKSLIEDLQGSNKYTTIYGIIGMLRKAGVFNGTQTDLSETSPLEKPSKDSIRRYIGNGMNDNTTSYAKIVIQYVEDNKPQKK